jgi:hypothetical protein
MTQDQPNGFFNSTRRILVVVCLLCIFAGIFAAGFYRHQQSVAKHSIATSPVQQLYVSDEWTSLGEPVIFTMDNADVRCRAVVDEQHAKYGGTLTREHMSHNGGRYRYERYAAEFDTEIAKYRVVCFEHDQTWKYHASVKTHVQAAEEARQRAQLIADQTKAARQFNIR